MREDRADGVDAARPDSRSALEELAHDQISARENLTRQRADALRRRRRQARWFMFLGFGPATLAAVAAAVVLERTDLILPFAVVGAGVQLFRIWRQHRRLRALEAELADPIDGS